MAAQFVNILNIKYWLKGSALPIDGQVPGPRAVLETLSTLADRELHTVAGTPVNSATSMLEVQSTELFSRQQQSRLNPQV